MSSAIGFISRNYKTLSPPQPPKEPDAIKFGILGAATVAGYAFINPALSHPGVKIEAIAARDPTRAASFAKKNNIPRVFNSYQELLDDPSIDAIYNPLPNGLHYEWTMKALKAGKHVLLEKPAANTSQEVANMFALAKEKGLVLLEARHYRFHPGIQTVKSLIEQGTIGKVKGVESELAMPGLLVPQTKNDIRTNLALGGGSMMDMGAYVMSTSRYLIGADPTDVLHISVNTYPNGEHPGVDRSIRAVLEFPNDVTAAVYTDFAMPNLLGFIPRIPNATVKVDGEEGSIRLNNFIGPSLWHSIEIMGAGSSQVKKTIKAYTFEGLDETAKGEEWWSSYRYQLEAFVDKVKGRTPQIWISEADSLANMKAIESVYENSGLGIRPASSYVP